MGNQVLKICTKLPKWPIWPQFCAELIYGFSRVMIEIFLMDRFFSLQRVRHLLWRRYQTIPGLSTGPICSEVSTKNGHFHQKCSGWCLAYYVCLEISDGNKNNFKVCILTTHFALSTASKTLELVIVTPDEGPV